MKNALIIMIKNPVQGKVKTRLAKDTGEEIALKIYVKLLEHTALVVQQVNSVQPFIFYSDVIDRNDMYPNTVFKKYTQCSGTLGERMEYAFSIPFKDEYKKVVIIGGDCFALTTQHIQEAFEKLETNDFVIGPAKDGGYYLLGMKKWNRSLFKNKSWSTSSVFAETKTEIENNKGKLFLLEQLHDIDTIADVNEFYELKNLAPSK